ncbi:SCO4848 family membrane protein [Microbacterium gilvum]|uniref:Integral membrane protein n=1 Tax=Microbacterium gilvum TaxID=1336204 RepID=A0ABP8ZQT1_9MICO
MTVLLAILLLVNAAFNIVVWPRFWKRITSDPRARDAEGRKTAFLTVHATLIGIAIAIAVASAAAGVWALVS